MINKRRKYFIVYHNGIQIFLLMTTYGQTINYISPNIKENINYISLISLIVLLKKKIWTVKTKNLRDEFDLHTPMRTTTPIIHGSRDIDACIEVSCRIHKNPLELCTFKQ
jgi:hypothetical protein